jgi:uncharacterized membrane protein
MVGTSIVLPFAYGALAGLRAFAAPATASLRLARAPRLRGPFAAALGSPWARVAFSALALTERAVGEWHPWRAPLHPALLALRAATGAAAGGAVAGSRRRRGNPVAGAVVGAAAALFTAVLGAVLQPRPTPPAPLHDPRKLSVADGATLGLAAGLAIV